MFLFWVHTYHDSDLPGLFDYRAATWGDAICLPLLIGTLVAYTTLNHEARDKARKTEIIMGLVSGMIAIAFQAQWLISSSTKLNWTIPQLHHFNLPGWYHAIFFVGMFATLGVFLTRFFYVKMAEVRQRNSFKSPNSKIKAHIYLFQKITQFIMWFSGSFFLFLLGLDDYTPDKNYSIVLLSVLAFLVAAVVAYYITILIVAKVQLCMNLIKSDMPPILSGVFSAFSLANIICGGMHAKLWCIVSCACLLVTFISPDENKTPQMVISYILICVPTLLLECAISSQTTFTFSAIVCCFSILVPCAIAIWQEDALHNTSYSKCKIASFVILLCYSLLFASLFEHDISNIQSILEALLSLILSFSISIYVKETFADLVSIENNKSNTNISIKKKKTMLYFMYVLIAVGATILLVSVSFPSIPLYNAHDKQVSTFALIAFVVSIILLFISGISRFKKYSMCKVFALICLSAAYMLLFATLTFGPSFLLTFPKTPFCFYILLIPMILYAISISLSFKYNLCDLKNIDTDKYITVSQVVIFIGTLTNTLLSAANMLYSHSIFSIAVNYVYIAFIGIFLPALIGLVLRSTYAERQITKNGQLGGITQDGFMYGISISMNELLSIFLLPLITDTAELTFTFVLSFFVSLIPFLMLISWLLDFCIKNNINHYKDRALNLNNILEAPVSVEEEHSLTLQLSSLKKYLTLQNILAFGNTLPYSVFTILTAVVECCVKDGDKWADLKCRFFLGEDNHKRQI